MKGDSQKAFITNVSVTFIISLILSFFPNWRI